MLNGFSALRVEVLPGGRRYRLTEDLLVCLVCPDILKVPAGFVTDFASVPRGLWNILPPSGPYSPAAVLHDWLYATGRVSRKEADALFLKAMELLGVPWWQRRAMWAGVRLCGWVAWNEYRVLEGHA